MLQLENETPFEAALNLFPDAQGVDTLCVTLKATFGLFDGATPVAEEQCPVQLGDEYWDDPETSSIRFANEAHLAKPGTDVVLVGSAQLPGRRPATELLAGVAVGPLRKQVQVFGEREWTGKMLGRRATPPEPFEAMPLVWERAFGGFHVKNEEKGKIYSEPRNPIGRSFRGKRSRSELVGTLLPNLEDPSSLLQSPGDSQDPAGFGYLSPGWQPRASFAGTYDETWQKTRAPYLPHDFDARFFLAAPEGLSSLRPLQGGEPVELQNVSPEGPIRFRLPRCTPRTEIEVAGHSQSPPFQLETVMFEPDEARFCLLWRTALPCDKQALRIDRVRIQLDELGLDGAAS